MSYLYDTCYVKQTWYFVLDVYLKKKGSGAIMFKKTLILILLIFMSSFLYGGSPPIGKWISVEYNDADSIKTIHTLTVGTHVKYGDSGVIEDDTYVITQLSYRYGRKKPFRKVEYIGNWVYDKNMLKLYIKYVVFEDRNGRTVAINTDNEYFESRRVEEELHMDDDHYTRFHGGDTSKITIEHDEDFSK